MPLSHPAAPWLRTTGIKVAFELAKSNQFSLSLVNFFSSNVPILQLYSLHTIVGLFQLFFFFFLSKNFC